MGVAPWWKFFAADYLMDPDVDALPLDAQGILIRMWCVVWIEGEIPCDAAEIARKCRIDILQVHMHMQTLCKFFTKTEHGALISVRMEKERSKSSLLSMVRAKAAKLKHQKDVSAHAYAKADAKEGANKPAKKVHSEVRSQKSDKDQKQKPSCADAQASMTDPRWADFIEDWQKAFGHVTGKKFKPSPADFAVLKKVLLDNPELDRETWRKCLNHWARSLISHTKPFRFWGMRILEYEQGPLDKFWEPATVNGVKPNGKSTAEQRVERNREKYARIEQRIAGVPADTGTGLSLGTGGSGNSHVAGEPELFPDSRDPKGSGHPGVKPA